MTMLMPSQYAEKLPATSPERMLSEDPPSSDEVTTSFTWRDSVEVKTFTSSGITAPARVPQEMMHESFHHRLVSPPRTGMIILETTKVRAMETNEVSHTSEVSGASKFMSSLLLYRLLAIASLTK